jgi:hypothetical protein
MPPRPVSPERILAETFDDPSGLPGWQVDIPDDGAGSFRHVVEDKRRVVELSAVERCRSATATMKVEHPTTFVVQLLHGRGIPPDVLVRPTLAGIRAGRDEVLEEGLRQVEQLLSRQKPRPDPGR